MVRKPLASFVFVFFVLGLAGLFRFSQNVRTVQVVGLFISGVACGVSSVGFVTSLRSKSNTE
jgi:ABC-type enterochelin transport system permease subunit